MSTVGDRGIYFYDVVDTNGNLVVDPAELAGRTCSNDDPGLPCLDGFDINNPSNVGDADSHGRRLQDADDPRVPARSRPRAVPNFGVSGTFTYRAFTNFTWRNNGLVGTTTCRARPLDGHDPAIGSYSDADLRADCVDHPGEPARRPSTATVTATRSATWASSWRRPSACRIAGWRASGSRRTTTASTSIRLAAMTDPTPVRQARPNDGRRPWSCASNGRQRQVDIYQVLPTYQFIADRALPGAVGHQPRRQHGQPPGLRDAVLPQPGGDHRPAARA